MSEILDNAPMLASIDSSFPDCEKTYQHNPIDFNTLETELQHIDPMLMQTDYDHYAQEQRIVKIYLERLECAREYYEAGNFQGAQSLINSIIALVKPTANIYLLSLLTDAHEKLY